MNTRGQKTGMQLKEVTQKHAARVEGWGRPIYCLHLQIIMPTYVALAELTERLLGSQDQLEHALLKRPLDTASYPPLSPSVPDPDAPRKPIQMTKARVRPFSPAALDLASGSTCAKNLRLSL